MPVYHPLDPRLVLHPGWIVISLMEFLDIDILKQRHKKSIKNEQTPIVRIALYENPKVNKYIVK